MIHLSESQAREFAAILEEYEDDIADINVKKAATLDDIRKALRDAGLKGSDLAEDLGKFRDAVAEHRLMRVNKAKHDKKLQKREGSDFYLFLLTKKASRTHEAEFLAPENSQVQTPHDADTGEIIETELPAKASVAVADATQAGERAEPVNEPKVDDQADRAERAEGGSPSPIIEIADTADETSLPEKGADHEQRRVTPTNETQKQAIDTPSSVPVSTVTGKTSETFQPDPSNKWIKNIGPEPEMPAFLKRATTDQVGRA